MFCPITPSNLGKISKPVSVRESAGPDNFKTGFKNHPRFEGVIGQNKIQRTYDHDCIYSM